MVSQAMLEGQCWLPLKAHMAFHSVELYRVYCFILRAQPRNYFSPFCRKDVFSQILGFGDGGGKFF